MMNSYIPIPCEIYDNYELAILRRSPLRICWRTSAGRIRVNAGVPVNIRTRQRGEFLLIRDRNQTPMAIRLDRILRTERLSSESTTDRS